MHMQTHTHTMSSNRVNQSFRETKQNNDLEKEGRKSRKAKFEAMACSSISISGMLFMLTNSWAKGGEQGIAKRRKRADVS